MKNLPNITSKWIADNSAVFKIEKIQSDENGIWIYYVNETTGQKYNCLADAFLSRFREQLA